MGKLYGRLADDPATEVTLRAACEVTKRPRYKTEAIELIEFSSRVEASDRKFHFPQTLLRMLESWPEALDKARTYTPTASPVADKEKQQKIEYARAMLKDT